MGRAAGAPRVTQPTRHLPDWEAIMNTAEKRLLARASSVSPARHRPPMLDGDPGRLLYRGTPSASSPPAPPMPRSPSSSGTGSGRRSPPCLFACPRPGDRLAAPPPPPLNADGCPAHRRRPGARGHGTPGPTLEQARAHHVRRADRPGRVRAPPPRPASRRPDPSLGLAAGFLYQLHDERPDDPSARALDAYFIVGADTASTPRPSPPG